MTFAQIPAGASIFVDANSLIYHFANDAKYGAACTHLVKRVDAAARVRLTPEVVTCRPRTATCLVHDLPA